MMTELEKRNAAAAAAQQKLISEGAITTNNKGEVVIMEKGNKNTDYSKVAKDSIPTSNKKRTYTNETPLVQSKASIGAKTTRTPSVAVVDEKMEAQFVLPEETPIEDMKTTVLAPPIVEPILPKIEVQTMAQKKTESQPAKKAVVKKIETVIPPSLLDVWQALELVEKEKQIENPLVHGARRFSEIEKIEQEWISKRLNLPDNALCIFNGVSGIGKTTWLCDVAAHISCGAAWSWGEECIEGPIVMCCPEDIAESTLLTRLEDTGIANLDNIIDFSYVEQPAKDQLHPTIKKPFTLPRDFAALSMLIAQVKPVAVFIDNVVRCFDKYTQPTFVTPHILNVLTEIAHLQNVAIIVVNHVYDSARKGGKAASKGASTIESAARVNWLAAPDTDNPEWIVISNNNINLAKPMEPLRYTRKTVVDDVQNEETEAWEEKERSFIVYYDDISDNPIVQGKQETALKSQVLMLLFENYVYSVEHNEIDRGIPRHAIVKSMSKQYSVNAVAACFKRLVKSRFVEKTGVGWYKLSDALKNDMLQVSACRRQIAALGIDIDAIPRLNVASLKQISASATAK